MQIVVVNAKGTISKATNKMFAKENQFFFFYKFLELAPCIFILCPWLFGINGNVRSKLQLQLRLVQLNTWHDTYDDLLTNKFIPVITRLFDQFNNVRAK